MSWLDFYRLFEKYNGDISQASEQEISTARRGNPNNPESAERLARAKWEDEEYRLARQAGGEMVTS